MGAQGALPPLPFATIRREPQPPPTIHWGCFFGAGYEQRALQGSTLRAQMLISYAIDKV